MRMEHVDRRVLGAVRFLDATTGVRIFEPLIVDADGVSWIRNRQGYYVIAGAPGLQLHTASFQEPPTVPALGSVSVELTVSDPGRGYLPRRRTIRLPRDPDPQNANRENSLFQLVDVQLFPSPTAKTAPGWAVIRATVSEEGTGKALSGALIRVVRASDSRHLASGLSDARGEALVAVPGIPITTWGEGNEDNEDGGEDDGPVLVNETEVTVEVVFDPDAGDIPDPDDLEARRDELPSNSFNFQLASGQTLVTTLTVPLP